MKLNKKLKLVKSLEKQRKKLKKVSNKIRDDIKFKEGDIFEHVTKNNEHLLIKVAKGGGCIDCCFSQPGGCDFEYNDKCQCMKWNNLVFVEER